MFYAYFLKSIKNGDIYIVSCEDINIRLSRHNLGRVKSTKAYRPWKLLGNKEYNTRSEAIRMEKFYKTKEQRELLRKQFANK